MDRRDDQNIDRDRVENLETGSSTVGDGETHATTGGAAAAGAVTGGVIGLAGGPVGAAIGAVGGAIVGAAAERMMHSDDDAERAQAGLGNDRDRNPLIEDRAETTVTNAANTDTDVAAARLDTGAPNASLSDTNYGTTPRSTELNTRQDLGPTTTNTTDEGGTMRLREEQLQARKQPVETGQVSIGKEVVEEERSMDVPVSREEAVIERHPVDRQPTDKPIGEGRQEIDVPLREERVTTEKQPVVYEEVGIGKHEVTDTQQVSGTIRREEARIEREGEANLREDDETLQQRPNPNP